MAVIGLQGLRGGVGTTSIVAALGWSLQQLGESVLVIDAAPDNLLRTYFNIGFSSTGGWARAMLDHQAWRASAWRYSSHLDVLPFGQLSAAERETFSRAEISGDFVAELKASACYSWILVDLPWGYDVLTRRLLPLMDSVLTVVNADANCHIRLHQQALPEGAHLLLNGLLVASRLQDDIYQLWLQSQRRLIPVVLHRDEAMAESAAMKQPPGEYRPDSLIAEEIVTLANWCLLHLSGKPHG